MPLGDTEAYAPFAHLRHPGRDPVRMLADARAQWHAHRGQQADLWVFGYASLIWRPDFDFSERHATLVHGWRDEVCPVDAVIRCAREHQAILHLVDDEHRLAAHVGECAQWFAQFLQRLG